MEVWIVRYVSDTVDMQLLDVYDTQEKAIEKWSEYKSYIKNYCRDNIKTDYDVENKFYEVLGKDEFDGHWFKAQYFAKPVQ